MPENQKQPGLKSHTIVFMIVVALFFDLLQWLFEFIYMAWLVGIFAWLTFFLWFKMHGISFFKSPKKLAAAAGSSLIEMMPIPIISSLPALTAAVVYIALQSKLKEVVAKVPGGQIAGKVLEKKTGI